MTIWAPGMRCVCVDDRVGIFRQPGHTYAGNMDGLQRGCVYTVEEVIVSPTSGNTLLVLCEIRRKRPPSVPLRNFTHGFNASRFRPLSETRLDQFRKHLNRIPAGKVSA